MKKIYSTVMMLAMMVAALSFSACSSSNDDDDDFGGGKKTRNTITITTDYGDVYYSMSESEWTTDEDAINGYLTDEGTIFCFMSRKGFADAVYLHIYLDNGEDAISDFPSGYDLGEPTLNFGILRTYTNRYNYVSGSIKVTKNDGKGFTLQFNDYVAAKTTGAQITITGNLYVEKEQYF